MSAAAMFLMNLLDDITFFLIERKVSLSHHFCNNIEIKITKLSMTPSLKFIVDFEYTGVFSPNCTVFLIIGIFGGYSPLEVVWL
jgi:hypothetical protein